MDIGRLKRKKLIKQTFSVGNLEFYECNCIAFGLTNAPATFQHLMECCMREMNLKECLIFLDDIFVFSQNFEEHLERLEAVFSKLKQHGLKLKPSKCEFFKTKVNYLGHVGQGQSSEIVFGLYRYYRHFIKDYAKIVKPLNDLLVGHPTQKPLSKKKKKTYVP